MFIFIEEPRALTHSGLPIEFERMCSPTQGALAGTVLFERWADDLDTGSM